MPVNHRQVRLAAPLAIPSQERTGESSDSSAIYLPLVVGVQTPQHQIAIPQVNAPYFTGEIPKNEAAIFWFGKVTKYENYSDVRVAYNPTGLLVQLNTFDRLAWYDTSPTTQDLERWDTATIFLDLAGNVAASPGKSAYRFTGQLNWWEDRQDYQAVYQGSAGGWARVTIPFVTEASWRGDTPNNMDADRGWSIAFQIPFSSLGLSGPPEQETVWGFAIHLYDRDDAAGTPIPVQSWPRGASPDRSATWAKLSFGLPETSSADFSPSGVGIIRHGLNGAKVVDGQVGGSTNCGSGLQVFSEWGEANYAGEDQINIQNQLDLADWPCFSKFYITFPLDKVPPGKKILSAKVTLYQFGNAGGSSWGAGPASLIQVLTVAEDWSEQTLTWNNAPKAVENVSRAWVEWLADQPPWPGVARSWDVSRAVDRAYSTGDPLRLVFYSADAQRHSGKYFISSDTGDWNEDGRPALEVVWGDP